MVEVTNPVGLLTGLATSGASLDEVLICSFNHTLPFFERVVLAPVRSMGARVTVLGDIEMAELDPAALSSINRRYYVGHVKAPRTFHPKLVVAVGAESATIAIGSGNLTAAGWLGNDELWTIHRISIEAPSTVAGSVAAWCRALPGVVRMSQLAADGLGRCADRLGPFDTSEPDDVAVVSSLDTPIIDQLPEGPVDRLNLYAPFHDHQGEAARLLVERLQPSAVTVGFQPGLTSAHGAQLRAALPPDTTFVELPALPYRHGKLIEWSIGSQWWSLTGSANLSTAALCRTARSGTGNVELGVVSASDQPLFPDGVITENAALDSLTPVNRPAGRSERPFLLAATLRPAGVEVEFIRILDTSASLRVADERTPPGSWDDTHVVEAGVDKFIAPPVAGGSRMQLVFGDVLSNIVYVTNPSEILQTLHSRGSTVRTPPPRPVELFTDPTAYQRLVALLEELRESTRPEIVGPGGTNGGAEHSTVGSWQDYLAEATTKLSSELLRFGLGTAPEITDGVSVPGPVIEHRNWDGDDPDTEPDAFEEQDTDAAAEEQLTTVSEYRVKQATRQRCWRGISRHVPDDDLASLIALRTMLAFVAAGGFDGNDNSWVNPLLGRVRRFAQPDYTESEASAASLVAVCLACTRSTLSRFIRTGAHAFQESVEREVSHLLVAAEPTLIEAYASDLRGRFASVLNVDDVMQSAADIVNDDPMTRGLRRAEHAGYSVTVTNGLLSVFSESGVTERVALRVASFFDRSPQIAVKTVSVNDASVWSVVIWQRPHLLVAGPATGEGRGFVYDLSGLGLSAVESGDLEQVSNNEIEFYMPGRQTGPIAARLLDASGLTRA